jgi:hypothetical protein
MASVILEDIKNLQHKYINFDSGMTIEQIVDSRYFKSEFKKQ